MTVTEDKLVRKVALEEKEKRVIEEKEVQKEMWEKSVSQDPQVPVVLEEAERKDPILWQPE